MKQATLLDDRDRASVGPRVLKDRHSPEWCWQTLNLLKVNFQAADRTWRDLERLIGELRDVRAWDIVPPGNPYGSLDTLLKEELGVSADQFEHRIIAAKARERGMQAAAVTTGEVLPADGSVNPGNARQFAGHSQADRAKSNGVSPRQQRKLDRLARDYPEQHERVKRGEVSIHRASVEAGFVREVTPLWPCSARGARRVRRSGSASVLGSANPMPTSDALRARAAWPRAHQELTP